MLARMYWKKVVSKGNRCYQVTKLENFKRSEELPEKYTDNAPCMYMFTDYFSRTDQSACANALYMCYPTTKPDEPVHAVIGLNQLLTESEKEDVVKWMKICGARLTSINKKLAKQNEGWAGEGFDAI